MILKRSSTLFVVLTLGILTLAASFAGAQMQTGDTPDVMALIISGSMPQDMASIIYNSEVPRANAIADLKEVARLAGWKVSNVSVSTEASAPGGPKMTSIDFQVDSGAVEWATGIIQVEPFIVALKRFDKIQINYALQGKLPFRSIRDYQNKYVDIDFDTTNRTYSYAVTVKDRDFDKLGLPLIVSQPKEGPGAKTAGNTTGGSGKIIWLALLLALAAGVVVYVISSRAAGKSKGAV